MEFCLRLRERNYLIVYTPYALLRHYESATRSTDINPRELSYMMLHWGQALATDPYYNPNLDLATTDFATNLSKPDTLEAIFTQRINDGVVGVMGPGREIGQEFTVTEDGLCAIGVQFATYGKPSFGQVRFSLRETPTTKRNLMVVEADAANIRDNQYYVFSFDPIDNSAGQKFYFCVEFVAPLRDSTLSVWKSTTTDPIAGPYRDDDELQEGTLAFAAYHVGHVFRHTRLDTEAQQGCGREVTGENCINNATAAS